MENNNATITYLLIGANVVMFLLCVIASKSIMEIDVYTLADFGGQAGVLIDYNHESWRMFTCMFLHGGIAHIAFNMYALYYFGSECERIFGKIKYIIIYFSSGLIGSFVSYKFTDPRTVSVGASGAIFGVIAALLIFCLLNKNKINKQAISSLVLIIAINLGNGFINPQIDNFGHMGGILGGVILGLIFTLLLKAKHNNY